MSERWEPPEPWSPLDDGSPCGCGVYGVESPSGDREQWFYCPTHALSDRLLAFCERVAKAKPERHGDPYAAFSALEDVALDAAALVAEANGERT